MAKKKIADWIQYINLKGLELGGEYSDFEMLAIQILDAEFDNYKEGKLERKLNKYLDSKANELGINREEQP
ncbi:MAG: hypothetical protein DRH08_09260 [Deltaproteobacteria bacterium]|nr:MAG: hypothetical protein DRH08_09260 [Deltaproteobacteria bacterium]